MPVVGRSVLTSILIIGAALCAADAGAQTPRVAPSAAVVFLDERPVDRFVVQRWINRDAADVSPAGMCDCTTLVYDGTRLVLDLGPDVGIVDVSPLRDVTGDARAELVVTRYSGGAHCCSSTTLYSVEDTAARSLLAVGTGNCQGEFTDLDQDGVPEFRTCDDLFAYTYCSFAFSPMPPVVYAYDGRTSQFVLATPAFARYLPVTSVEDARQTMADNRDSAQISRCAALAPALDLIYTGRLEEGRQVLRSLYQAPDVRALEDDVLAQVRESPQWTEQ